MHIMNITVYGLLGARLQPTHIEITVGITHQIYYYLLTCCQISGPENEFPCHRISFAYLKVKLVDSVLKATESSLVHGVVHSRPPKGSRYPSCHPKRVAAIQRRCKKTEHRAASQ